ncbi:unnamed protein product [Adineta ricciae]|uniref:Uncharacterized protein n=1 Tax=Adineta ricciae TaxID=249248 RepID=A0A816HIX1_ADIRI|nr:unnamed protein product [Adineta ricciae]CAF1686610.1 unnamed protein product [Adineta ricciae]
MNSNDTVFSGFAGGHDSVPGVGNVPPSTGGSEQINVSMNSQLDAHTHVDPTHFPGIVHWGPEQVIARTLPAHPPVDK